MRTLKLHHQLQFARQKLSRVVLLILAGFTEVGCSGTSDAVRPELAKETLTIALTAWKEGKTLASVKTQSSPIVVQDKDWSAESKLSRFALQGDGTPLGANLSIEVELLLIDKAGKTSQQNVWYLVGTDPALTVFRDLLHD